MITTLKNFGVWCQKYALLSSFVWSLVFCNGLAYIIFLYAIDPAAYILPEWPVFQLAYFTAVCLFLVPVLTVTFYLGLVKKNR